MQVEKENTLEKDNEKVGWRPKLDQRKLWSDDRSALRKWWLSNAYLSASRKDYEGRLHDQLKHL